MRQLILGKEFPTVPIALFRGKEIDIFQGSGRIILLSASAAALFRALLRAVYAPNSPSLILLSSAILLAAFFGLLDTVL